MAQTAVSEASHASPTSPAPARRGLLRRAWRFLLNLVTWTTVVVIILGVAGQVVRDRNLAFAMFMYVPLSLAGIAAILFDLLRRGRSLRYRFGLTMTGIVALAVGVIPMLGLRSPMPAPPEAQQVTLLHWNMQSGGRRAAKPRWERAAEQILARQPDIIVLSEAPPDRWLFDSLKKHSRGWKTVQMSNPKDERYWYKPVVCSRWPMTMDGHVPVDYGVAMSVTVTVRDRPLRLLVVDGVSWVTVLRTHFLHDVAAACDEAAKAGRPYDVVVGDFNAVGRSFGFDALRATAGGYARASDYSGEWRGTWPVPLPVYDIDHVLVRNDAAVLGCDLFSSHPADTDHRGQLVTLGFTPAR